MATLASLSKKLRDAFDGVRDDSNELLKQTLSKARYEFNKPRVGDGGVIGRTLFNPTAQNVYQNTGYAAGKFAEGVPVFGKQVRAVSQKLADISGGTGPVTATKPATEFGRKAGVAAELIPATITLGGLSKAPTVFGKAGSVIKTGGTSAAIGGGLNKAFGGTFTEGAKEGYRAAPVIQGISLLTNPLLAKSTSRVASQFNNPLLQQLSGRVAAGGANVLQGIPMNKALNQPAITPLSAGIDFATGLVGGKRTFDTNIAVGRKPSKVHPEDVGVLDQAMDMLQNKKAKLEGIESTEYGKQINLLADKYLRKDEIDKVVTKTKGKDMRKYYVELGKALQKKSREVEPDYGFADRMFGKLGIVDDDPLIQEARKYKSAEEFVNKQTFYRGETGGSGNYFTRDMEFANEFSNGKPLTEVGIPENSIYRSKVLPEATNEQQITNAIKEAKSKGFKAIYVDEGTPFGEPIESVFVFDKSAINTKSQLTDIWNKANQPINSPYSMGIVGNSPTKTTQSPELSTKDTGLSKPQEGLLNPKTDMQKFDSSRTSLSNILALTGKSTGVAGETFNIQDLNPPVDRKQGVKLSKQLLKGEQKATINLKKQNIKDAAAIIAKSIKENTNSKVQKEVKASGGVLSNSHTWKDKAKLLLKRETMERNFEDIMGADAPKMKQVYIDPIKKSEADRMRFLSKERSDIAKLGIAPKSKESELLQRFGEKQIDAATLKKQAPESYEKIIKAEKVFREKYDKYLTDINLALTRNGYDPIPKRKDYFRHFNEVGSVLEQFGIPVKDDLIPTDIVGLTADFRPSKNFFASALPRLGKMTEVDAIRGIDKYLDGASNQIYHTDNIQRMRGLERSLRDMHAGTGQLSNFVAELTEYTNKLAGKKSMIDRAAEDLVGRKFYSGANFLKRQTGSNMVGLNVASALTNFIPFTQSLATTSKDAAIRGLIQTMRSVYRDDGFAKKSDFLTSRIGADPLYRTAWENAQDKGFYLMRVVDRFVSESVVRGKYLEGLQKGMSDSAAIKYADDYAGKLLGNRSKGMMPTLFESQTLGALTQFQLEVNNQLSYMFKDIPRMYDKKGAASALAQIFLFSYLFNEAFEKVTGRRPAFDPIGVAFDTYEDYTNEDMKKGQATKNLIGNVANQLPFASAMTGGRIPLANVLPNPIAVATGESTLKKEASDMFFGLVPPTAGNQLRKTSQGLQSYSQGSSKTPSGGVRYPIEQSGANLARTVLFGQYSVPEARTYLREGRTPLGEKQTAMFDSMDNKAGYYESVLQDRRDNKQNDIVRERVAQTGQEETSNGRLFYMGTETDSKTGEVKKVVKSLDVSDIEQTNAETGLGKYIITTETGNKAVVDLTKPLEKPEATGQKELDKELISRYNSSITTRINNIEKVYLDGQMTAGEAEKAISDLKAQKITTGKAKKKGVKVSLPKITLSTSPISKSKIRPVGTIKLKKAPKLKLKAAKPTSIKLAKKNYSKGKPIKFRNTLSDSLTKLV